MIFPLIRIQAPIDKIYDVPLTFFENSKYAYECSPSIFPLWFRPVLQRCPGVQDRFDTLFKKYKQLKKNKQNRIIDLYRNSRQIVSVFQNATILYPGLDQIDSSVQAEIRNLFEFLFEQTIGTDIFRQQSGMHIDDHYKRFFQENEIHVCPFCGLETYTLPKYRRAEYDHFLPISIYPWLGVNFNNLVPMGDHCNGKKNAANVLYSNYKTKSRRLVWYPYEWLDYEIKLKVVSKPTLMNLNGTWEIDLFSKNKDVQDKLDTWDKIFQIKSQFSEGIATYHKKFIDDLIHKNSIYGHRLTIKALKAELKKYRNSGIGDEKIETMATLKKIWADYHINVTDSAQLTVLVYQIAHSRRKPSLLN